MAYFTKADVENFLNIDLNPSGVATVDALIPAVSTYANSYCNREWDTSTLRTDYFDGNGQNLFFTKYSPITSIDEITVDGVAVTDTEYFTYSSYVTFDYAPAYGRRNIVIKYRSNDPLPSDLKHALIRWTADIFKASPDAGKTAERVKFGNAETWFKTQDGVPQFVQTVLDRYRLMPV